MTREERILKTWELLPKALRLELAKGARRAIDCTLYERVEDPGDNSGVRYATFVRALDPIHRGRYRILCDGIVVDSGRL